jgi:hypothetical protein
MIAARDYVDIRAYKSLPVRYICLPAVSPPPLVFLCVLAIVYGPSQDGSIVSGGPSTEHPDYPPRSGYVRGFNFPSGFWFGAVPDQPNKTR